MLVAVNVKAGGREVVGVVGKWDVDGVNQNKKNLVDFCLRVNCCW